MLTANISKTTLKKSYNWYDLRKNWKKEQKNEPYFQMGVAIEL